MLHMDGLRNKELIQVGVTAIDFTGLYLEFLELVSTYTFLKLVIVLYRDALRQQ